MNLETKEKYLEVINNLEYKHSMLKELVEFINKYEGPESEELHKVLIGFIGLTIEVGVLEEQLDVYAEMETQNDENLDAYKKFTDDTSEDNESEEEEVLLPMDKDETK